MKVITHAVIGMTIYQAMNRSNWHISIKKPVLAATVIGSVIPDIDLLFSVFGGEDAYLKWHRGITHSIFFIPVFSIIIWLAAAVFMKTLSPRVIIGAALGVSSHLFFDLLNQWGTGLLEPFFKLRFSLGVISFTDVILWIIIICAYLACLKSSLPMHVVFKGSWVILFTYISIQTIMGFILFERFDNHYEKQVISASFIPGVFEVVGKDGKNVDVLKATVWNRPAIIREYVSDDDADLNVLLSQNRIAKTLYNWAPITVVVNNSQELGVFDPRFFTDGKPKFYEYIKK